MTPSSGQNFFGRLVERSLGQPAAALGRRRPGLFEPRATAPATVVENTLAVESAATPRFPTADVARPVPPLARVPEPASPPPLLHTTTRVVVETSPPPVAPRIAPPSPSNAAPRIDPSSQPRPQPPAPLPPKIDPPAPHAPLQQTRPAVAIPGPPAARGADLRAPTPPPALPKSERVIVERTHHETRATHTEHLVAPAPPAPLPPIVAPAAPPRVAARETTATRIAHPSRSAALVVPTPAAPAAAPAPVQVSIGRVEIRGPVPPTAAPAARTPREPQLGLDEYLRQRHGNAR